MKDNTVLTEQTKDLVIAFVVERVKPHVPVLARPLLKPAVGIVVRTVNSFGAKHIPDKVDPYINEAILRIDKKDWENAAASVGMAADILIDIPTIDDAHESNVFVSLAQALVQSIRCIIEKKKNE